MSIYTPIQTYLKRLILAVFLVIAVFSVNIQNSHADDTNIGASVTFLESLILIAEELEFGVFSFTLNAGANDIVLSPSDGAITCSNTTEYTCPASGKTGEVTISGTSGRTLNISCDSTAIMSNGTEAFDVQEIKMSASGAETGCAGIGSTSGSITLSGIAEDDMIKLGAKLVIPETGISTAGAYSTASSGGDPIAVQVLYQ